MIYRVVVDISNGEVDKTFDYSSDEDYPVGSRVKVPFGKHVVEGFVVGTKEKTDVKTKNIISNEDDFVPLTAEAVALAEYLKKYKNLRLIDSIRLCVPSQLRGGKAGILSKSFLESAIPSRDAEKSVSKNAPKQLAVLERLKRGGEFESVLNREYGYSAVQALLKKGLIAKKTVRKQRIPYKNLKEERTGFTLTTEQSKAVVGIENSDKDVILIHGVTGSGKTEIYLKLIENTLKRGKTAIMLVPEISLTPQMLSIFRARFEDSVGVLHSGLSVGERFDEWLRLLNGEAKVALGARSAIFAPVRDVGIIIIDEEHDGSYVSESNPRYFTREVAEFRRKYNGAKLVLGSATPSLSTYKEAAEGKIGLIKLRNRINKKPLPGMEIVDMRVEVRAGNASMFSRLLLSELAKTLEEGNQAMIFINRRGYSSFVRCNSCGYIPKCEDCEVSLTYHKEDNRLKCHYCGKQYKVPEVCPVCGRVGLSRGRIGTETVIEELGKLFPDVKTLRLDNDAVTGKDSVAGILSAFKEGEAQILVGTQMIVKGHDFKNVTLVGVMDADLSLYFSDYRSNETTFQQITQVAGRAGRENKDGKVVIQTYNPRHYVFRFAATYDYEGFYEKEANIRKATKFPPYSIIARILIRSKDENKAISEANRCYSRVAALKTAAPELFQVRAMRAPITRIGGEYRFQVIARIAADASPEVINAVYKSAVSETRGVVNFIEINPTQMR